MKAMEQHNFFTTATQTVICFVSSGVAWIMGILNHVDDVTYARKPVADYARQMVMNFGDYVWDATISTSPYVMRFKNGSNVAYFIWKVETATPAAGSYTLTENTGTYNLSLPTNPAITVKNFQTTNDNMTSSSVQVTGGTYAVSYGMKPVVIEVAGSVSGNFLKIPQGKRVKFKQQQVVFVINSIDSLTNEILLQVQPQLKDSVKKK